MDYAIVLYMDDQKTKMAEQMTRALAAACGSDYCMKTIPHISIASLIAEDEEEVRAEAEKLSRLLKRGKVNVASIGVFNPAVLFLAPIKNLYLLEACRIANDQMLRVCEIGNQGRYLPDAWVPHIAVAMKMEKDGLYQGFNKLSELFSPFDAEIDRMALIRWERENPYQELAVYELAPSV